MTALIKLGATPDVKGWGQSALHLAVVNGNVGLVAVLLKHRANATILNDEECTPLMLIGKSEPSRRKPACVTMCMHLLGGGGMRVGEDFMVLKEFINDSLKKDMHECVREVVQRLLSWGVDPNSKDESGKTVLQVLLDKSSSVEDGDETKYLGVMLQTFLLYGANAFIKIGFKTKSGSDEIIVYNKRVLFHVDQWVESLKRLAIARLWFLWRDRLANKTSRQLAEKLDIPVDLASIIICPVGLN